MTNTYFYRIHKDGSVKEAAFSLSLGELKQYVAIGTLKSTDELQEEGGHEWVPASTMLPELFSTATTADITPVSSVEVASPLPASTMLPEPFSDEKEAGVAAIASVEVASPLPGPSIQPEKWYYRIRNNGSIEGSPYPVTLQEMKALVASGKLKPTDELQADGTQPWVPARWILPDLFPTDTHNRARMQGEPARISSDKSGPNPTQEGHKPPTLKPCPDCSHMVSLRATACPNCGAPQESQAPCPDCGQEFSSTAASCPHCGAPRDTASNTLLSSQTVKPMASPRGETGPKQHETNRPASLKKRILLYLTRCQVFFRAVSIKKRILLCGVVGVAVLVLALIGIQVALKGNGTRQPQQQGNATIPNATSIPPQEKEAAENALKSLMKLDSLTKTGMKPSEYSSRLLDIKVDYDLSIAKVPASNSIRPPLDKAMAAFVEARVFWGYCLSHPHQEFTFDKNGKHIPNPFYRDNSGSGVGYRWSNSEIETVVLDVLQWEQKQSHEEAAKISEQLKRPPPYELHPIGFLTSRHVGVIWAFASARINEAKKIQTSQISR